MVEQRTENPCVLGSIPSGTTKRKPIMLIIKLIGFFAHGGVVLYNYYLKEAPYNYV